MNACGFDRFDFYGCLDRAESEIANEIRWRIGPSDFPNTFGGMANWTGFDYGQRGRRVREAINESQSIALRNLHAKLGDINLQDVWPLLAESCHDLALYIGGGAIAGEAIGSGLGFMVLGVGAIPGAAAGTALGAKLGVALLNFIGLRSVIEYMIDSVPLAIAEYQKGFVDAWGPVPLLDGHRLDLLPSNYYFGSSGLAAHSFASGHEIVIIALLMGIVAYLERGNGNLHVLLSEAKSGRLGPKFATWLEERAEKLAASPMLQVRSRVGGQAIRHNLPGGTASGLGVGQSVPVRALGASSITSSAAKISFETRGLNPDKLDPHLLRNFGNVLADDPAANAALRQMQRIQGKSGGQALLHFTDGPAGLAGRVTSGTGRAPTMDIFMNNSENLNARGAASTFVHETSHFTRASRGFEIGTQLDEYIAFRRETLFALGRRPTILEKQNLWLGKIQNDPFYAMRPIGGQLPTILRRVGN